MAEIARHVLEIALGLAEIALGGAEVGLYPGDIVVDVRHLGVSAVGGLFDCVDRRIQLAFVACCSASSALRCSSV